MIETLKDQLKSQIPFSLIEEKYFELLFEGAALKNYKIGSTILRPGELNSYVYLTLKGQVRLLGDCKDSAGAITLDKRGKGQLIGWTNLVRGYAFEHTTAATDVVLLALPSNIFVESLKSSPRFGSYFYNLPSIQESFQVLTDYYNSKTICPDGWKENILGQAATASVLSDYSFSSDQINKIGGTCLFLVSSNSTGRSIGSSLSHEDILNLSSNSLLPARLVCCPEETTEKFKSNLSEKVQIKDDLNSRLADITDLHALGIIENEDLDDDIKYQIFKGYGDVNESLAICESVAVNEKVPFKKDVIKKILLQQLKRDKGISIELLAGLLELLGLNSQLAEIDTKFLSAVEGPAVFMYKSRPVILFAFEDSQAVLGCPHEGIVRVKVSQLQNTLGEKVKFTLPRRVASTPTSRFGWGWFTPLIKKYKTALILVFVSSLLAQLFSLAIPLMLQQIIDKVLSQGNLSSLNILGTAMIVMALFSGILNALRTYIFIDTTDRMDLTLGSAVIDRLLALPLSYFEKRPVGELSQRLGELNTIRGFLTGTALMSILNLVFASLYLIVMFIYSPFLSIIALSTFPVYLLIVFVVAPIYKSLIRAKAVASAKTQSHLIEVLGGIQTVKAQHFELTARWKWQDRYRKMVNEGFKSSALGSTAGEFGKFLNQVSSLLVLWCGMYLVLQGEFTLGQLIAFRIISGNVTSPLLQLAGLYQGLQGVQLSMERLSDILDKNPEFNVNPEDSFGQIALPPIQGDIRFEDVCFKFGTKGPYQVNHVDLRVKAGNFVGIVGQSGSGKSTLMKLLPRLYDPQEGRIFIDNYDIGKVDLSSLRRQIGIVPQDSLLFEGTISENIALNDPQASSEAIIEAAKIACAHDFIMQLGQGYATPLSEKGSNLSGGQRQRIAIARTILSNPNLLVMDEATSALDFNTEKQLCQNLQIWAEDKTVLFITHRLSTIMNSDQILMMHDGQLVEKGSHKELMDLNGRYFALYNQQSASMN